MRNGKPLLIALSSSVRPHRIIVWMEFLPQVLSVPRDINEHNSSSRSLNSAMCFGNNGSRPAPSCLYVRIRLHYMVVYLTSNNHQVPIVVQAIGSLDAFYLFVRSIRLDDQLFNLALRIS